MKKLWALCIVLVLVMLTVPCAFAAGASVDDPEVIAEENMQEVYGNLMAAISVPAGETYYCQLNDLKGYSVNISCFNANVTVETGEFARNNWYWNEVEGGTFIAEDAQMVRVTNKNTSGDAAFCEITASDDVCGTWDNPEVITELGTFTASVLGDSEGYYYSWTATGDGKLTVTATAAEVVMVSLSNNTTYFSDSQTAENAATVSLDVSTGDEIVITVFLGEGFTSDAGDVDVTLTFSEGTEEGTISGGNGTWDDPAVIDQLGDFAVETEAESFDGFYYKWIATGNGTLNVNAATDGRFVLILTNNTAYVYNDCCYATDAGSDSIAVSTGDEVIINVAMDTDDNGNTPAGQFDLSISFTEGEGGGSESGDVDVPVDTEKYVDYMNEYSIDNAVVTPVEGYTYSVFQFVPAESGVYTITAPEGVLLSYWGSSAVYVGFNFTENETNTLEVEYTYGCIWVGVQANEAVTLTFTKTGDAQENTQTTYTNVEATQTPYSGDEITGWKWVNVLDGTIDTAVLGEDGYYHLNSADGPVLFVDLNATRFNIVLSEANGTGALKDAVNHIQYKHLVNTYLEAGDSGVVALTEELMTMLQNVGSSKGWFGSNMNMNIFNKEIDEDEAWMFACKYSEDVTSLATGDNGNDDGIQVPSDDETPAPDEEPAETPSVPEQDNNDTAGDNNNGNDNNGGNDENPKMGDINVSVIAAALVLSTMGLAVVAKKKF